ncbi:MAG: Gfo/Idh/MocA family oxidoreductase, partial [Rhodospirillaceae bacterium]|nr:Gfo/Idh/MocA family oxidoreductase [Rhodospirillaceae bacterium]
MGVRHAELVHTHPRCSLVGICDMDPDRQAAADRFGVPFYTSVEALLERDKPAGAIIATSNAHHVSVAEACAEQAVHVLIEKPIADTIEGARRIVEVTRRCGTRVLVGYHRRHNALILKARELVQGGEIGSVVGVSVLWAALKPDDYFDIGWHRERLVGGPTLINLVHDLDSLRFICGEITDVHAQMRSNARGLDVEDSVSVSLCFEGGALGTILASDACPSPWSYEATTAENPAFFHAQESCYHFLGTQGSLAFPTMELWRYADGARKGWHHPLERVRIEVAANDPLRAQLEHFRRVVEGQEEPILDAEEGYKSLAVALAALRFGHLSRAPPCMA